ncbi:MFS transporter [Embleya scabrispora]|uniref:MFS transporter n=1 Tax=Embleya scabrispora TaxID=159449 RepID=UPI0003784466|nr:MFS transporter [Embleya scabrispora]MYS85465.1 DHA2 family efflux MFS transporter permease subunit [Streptomyces sp. SID5474]
MPQSTAASAVATSTPSGPTALPRRWLILAVIALAQVTVVLDATIVNIALPSAQRDLGFSDGNRQWVVTAYALAFGSLLLLGGRIADLFGRRNAFLIGLLGFALASAAGGAAPNFEVLVAARALQGVFGALLAPAALSLLTTTFTDPAERGKAFGVFGAVAGAGGGVGLLLGGLLTQHLDWRWCLYVNLILAGGAIIGGVLLLGRHEPAADRPRLDLPGTLAVSAGLFALVYGFSRAESDGWSDPLTYGCLIAAVALLAVFTRIQSSVANPLLPLRVVVDRDRGAALLGMLIAGAGMFGMFLFLTFYMQQTLHYSPVRTGLSFLPMVFGIMCTATSATVVLLPRFGPKPIVPTGMGLAALGLLYLTRLDLDSTYATDLMPGLIMFGAGVGLVIAPCMSAATFGVRAEDSGVASAAVNTVQQVGGSVGIALLSTLSATAGSDYLKHRQPSPQAFAHAALESYATAYRWSAAFFAIGLVVTAVLFRPGAPATDPDAAPVVHM